MLCIKCGMQSEYALAVAHAAPDVLVLSGVQTVENLQGDVPPSCTAILSFGLCGGLARGAAVGETFIAAILVSPGGKSWIPDAAWSRRLQQRTSAMFVRWHSSGLFNTANTPAQRSALYLQTQAWCIDDESLAVAQFAAARKIKFAILRVVSDGWNDDVSVAAGLLDDQGGIKPFQVAKAFVTHPVAMSKIWYGYRKSMAALAMAATDAGPYFQS